jgi:hypothetical protein
MENQSNNDITIPYCDLEDAAENIIYDRYREYDEIINRDSIMRVLKNHLECAIEEILSYPSQYFKDKEKFWKDLENNVELDDDF